MTSSLESGCIALGVSVNEATLKTADKFCDTGRGVGIGVGAVVWKVLGGVCNGVGAGVLTEFDHARTGVRGTL